MILKKKKKKGKYIVQFDNFFSLTYNIIIIIYIKFYKLIKSPIKPQ